MECEKFQIKGYSFEKLIRGNTLWIHNCYEDEYIEVNMTYHPNWTIDKWVGSIIGGCLWYMA